MGVSFEVQNGSVEPTGFIDVMGQSSTLLFLLVVFPKKGPISPFTENSFDKENQVISDVNRKMPTLKKGITAR